VGCVDADGLGHDKYLLFLRSDKVLKLYGNKETHNFMPVPSTLCLEPIGKVKIISDFLPSPEELALRDETVKVTIVLSKTSADFFKKKECITAGRWMGYI